MTIVSLTGADIARVLENEQHVLCVKLSYEQGVIHSNGLCSTASGGCVLMWVISPSACGLSAGDFYKILTHVTEKFPNKKVIWAYEEVDNKQYTEMILLITP